MQYVTLVAIAMLACGKSDKPDCEAYARHATELNDPAPGKEEMILGIERTACESGRISKQQIDCVNRASTREGLLECYGLGKKNRPAPVDAAPPVDAAIDAPPEKGTSHVTLVDVRNAGSFHPIDSAKPDQKQWLDKVKTEIAACETKETYVPRQIAMLVTFSPKSPTFYLQGVPDPLGNCLKGAVMFQRQPASVGNGPADFIIDLGK